MGENCLWYISNIRLVLMCLVAVRFCLLFFVDWKGLAFSVVFENVSSAIVSIGLLNWIVHRRCAFLSV